MPHQLDSTPIRLRVLLFAAAANAFRHFGYYGGGIDDFGDQRQLAEQVNTVFVGHTWVLALSSNMTALAEADAADARSAKRQNISVILECSQVFFEANGTGGELWSLRGDWQQRLQQYHSTLLSHGGTDNLLALYPIDEPNGHEQLAVVTPLLRSLFDVPIMAVLTPAMMLAMRDGRYALPAEIDWLGFDQYGCWDATTCWQNVSIPTLLEIIDAEAQRRPQGKVFVVPDAMSPGPVAPSIEIQRYKLENDRRYVDWCAANPRCDAVLPFLWQTVPSCCVGLDLLPVLSAFFEEVGRQTKGNWTKHLSLG
jgi:hypothetical protein